MNVEQVAPRGWARHRTRWLSLLVAGIVLAAVLIFLVVLRGGNGGSSVKLPASFAGYTRDDTPTGHQVDQLLQYKVHSVGLQGSAGTGLFRSGDSQQLAVIVIRAQQDSSTVLTKLETAVAGLNGSISSVSVEPSGPHGGSSQCGVVVPDLTEPLACEWSDAKTIGILETIGPVAPSITKTQLSQVELALRDSIE